MSEPQFAFSRDFKVTLDVRSNVTPKPVVSFRVTIRTSLPIVPLIRHTTMVFIETCRALFDGELPTGKRFAEDWFRPYVIIPEPEEAYVNIYSLAPVLALIDGTRKPVSLNKVNETTSAVALCNAVYASEAPILEAIGSMAVGNSELVGEREATLQPDTPYPVPNATPRVLRDGELPTMQAALASRKRHNPFAIPVDESDIEHYKTALRERDKDTGPTGPIKWELADYQSGDV